MKFLNYLYELCKIYFSFSCINLHHNGAILYYTGLVFITQYPPFSFYKKNDFKEFSMLYLNSLNDFLSFDIQLSTKKYKLNEKTKILFIKACTKKCVSQKWREMTRTTFVKNALTPKLFGIFEFCKKTHIIKSQKPRSFKGKCHFWGVGGMNV